MNIIASHIERLGIESTKMPKDGEIFATIEQVIKTEGENSIEAIMRVVTENSNELHMVVGGGMALTLYGVGAKTALQNLIINQSERTFRTEIIRQVYGLYKEWIPDTLTEIIDNVDDITATQIRRLKTTRIPLKASVMIPSLQDIKMWTHALLDTDHQKNALENLSHPNSLTKLDDNLDQARQIAQLALNLVDELTYTKEQIKAIQFAYRYSPNLEDWSQALTWFETRYMDARSIGTDSRDIFEVMNITLDHLSYKTEALNLLDRSILNFVKQNEVFKLESAAIKIIKTNNLPKPPDEYLVRNKTTIETISLKCAECGKEMELSEVVNVPMLRVYFCSQEHAKAYMIRNYGSMNPQNL